MKIKTHYGNDLFYLKRSIVMRGALGTEFTEQSGHTDNLYFDASPEGLKRVTFVEEAKTINIADIPRALENLKRTGQENSHKYKAYESARNAAFQKIGTQNIGYAFT